MDGSVADEPTPARSAAELAGAPLVLRESRLGHPGVPRPGARPLERAPAVELGSSAAVAATKCGPAANPGAQQTARRRPRWPTAGWSSSTSTNGSISAATYARYGAEPARPRPQRGGAHRHRVTVREPAGRRRGIRQAPATRSSKSGVFWRTSDTGLPGSGLSQCAPTCFVRRVADLRLAVEGEHQPVAAEHGPDDADAELCVRGPPHGQCGRAERTGCNSTRPSMPVMGTSRVRQILSTCVISACSGSGVVDDNRLRPGTLFVGDLRGDAAARISTIGTAGSPPGLDPRPPAHAPRGRCGNRPRDRFPPAAACRGRRCPSARPRRTVRRCAPRSAGA